MQVFDAIYVLYVYHGEFIAGVYYHPNREACEARLLELEALKVGYRYKIVEYVELERL